MKLTRAEIEAGIGIKSLIIARDCQGNIARVMSPHAAQYWQIAGGAILLAPESVFHRYASIGRESVAVR